MFTLTYANKDPQQGTGVLSLEGSVYDVPDGITASADSKAGGTEATMFRGLHTIDENKFSTSVEASLDTGETSASASFSLAKTSNVDADTSNTTTVIAYYKVLYSLRRGAPGELTADFAKAMANLPDTYAPDNEASFTTFFQTWGTHYFKSGYFGGSWLMKTVLSTSDIKTLTTEDIKTAIATSFKAGTASGSAKSEIATSTSNSTQNVVNASNITWSCVGGDSDKELNDWLISILKNPNFLMDVTAVTAQPIAPTFNPIWILQTDPQKQDALKQAWQAYLPPERTLTLPPPIGASTSVDMQVSSDGFLSAGITTGANGDDHGWFDAFTGDGTHPTQRVAGASMQNYDGAEINQSTCFMPVRKGNFYRVDYTQRRNNPSTQATFQPFPLAFGAWQEIGVPLDRLMVTPAKTDGFLVVKVQYDGQNGTYGSVIGAQGTGNPATFKRCGAATVQWYDDTGSYVPVQSFCMPVVQGNDYCISFEQRDAFHSVQMSQMSFGSLGIPGIPSGGGGYKRFPTPLVFAHWLPMGGTRRMSPVNDTEIGSGRQAQTDVIVFGYLVASFSSPSGMMGVIGMSGENSRGKLTIEIADNPNFSGSTVIARTSAQCYGGKTLSYNSIAAVIPQGTWWRAIHFCIGFQVPVVRWVGVK
ncbi:MAG: MAC/perforin domain-containing protein [Xanthobacteraceae bacterium]